MFLIVIAFIVVGISNSSLLLSNGDLVESRKNSVSLVLESANENVLSDHSGSTNFTDEGTSENVTAQLGSSVYLACKTHHSMERQVSWVRRRDWHILTSGTAPYTKEERFLVHHSEGSTEWTLEIKYIQLSDEGTYECQIATGGGILSHLVYLRIVSPRAMIPGNGEYHVETGSTITLDCIIEQSPVAPQFIFWYHDEKMINYDTERGGVNVSIDKGPPNIRSRLAVTDARPTDSGNYTCDAANTESASILVYITEANKIAVIQPRSSNSCAEMSHLGSLFVSVIFNIVLFVSFYNRSDLSSLQIV